MKLLLTMHRNVSTAYGESHLGDMVDCRLTLPILLSCDWLEFQSFYIDWVRLASCSASHDDQRTDYLIYYLLLFYHIIIILLLHYYCAWPEIWPSRYFWVSVFIAVYVSLTLSLFSLGSFAKNNSKLEHLFLIISINFINRERAKQLIQDKSFRK